MDNYGTFVVNCMVNIAHATTSDSNGELLEAISFVYGIFLSTIVWGEEETVEMKAQVVSFQDGPPGHKVQGHFG